MDDLIDDGTNSDEQAGFDNDDDMPTGQPPATEDDEQQPAQQAQPEPTVEYAQLTKAEWEEVKARAARIDEIRATQDKSFGTIGNTIRGMQETLKAAQSGAQVEIAQADIDALRDDFPPLAAALEKVRSMRAIPVNGGLDQSKVEELLRERIAKVEQKFEFRLLAKDHPDWQQIDADPAFTKWTAEQSEAFQRSLAQASAEYDSATVSKAMTLFKEAKAAAKAKEPAKPDTTRKSRFDAAVTPRGSGVNHNAVLSDEKSGFDAA